MRRRRSAAHRLGLLTLALLAAAPLSAQQQTRVVIDSVGRRVEVLQPVARVLAAGPPAVVLLYTLAPEKMIGWVKAPSPAAKAFFNERARELPEYGRLTGRHNFLNLENLVKLRPDLIIDFGSVAATYVALANSVQEQAKVPYILLDGSLQNTPAAYRMLGEVLGVKDRAEQLARYAEDTLGALKARMASIPDGERPRVYLARGADGLETDLVGSTTMEVLEFVGATNVAAAAGSGGLAKGTVEQVQAWDPNAVLALDPIFYKAVQTDPLWSSVRAVREKRIYLVPSLPYGWLDTPPSVNRLMGVRWLMPILYPRQFPEDLHAVTREFYKLFYQVDLSERQINELWAAAVPATRER
jgi:iron complex transport system substrate-binding protein